MSQAHRCPQCDAPLDSAAPEGLCPKCLLLQGVNLQDQVDLPGPRDAAPVSAEQVGRLFEQLEVLELLGQNMGAVFKVRQRQLDRTAVLKILPPRVGQDADFVDRFTREAQALARLNHPHIVTMYEFGQKEDCYYFLMEYVDGVNLRQAMADGNLAPQQALAIVPQICDALQYAHQSDVVHRDIKPENILLDKRGVLKIADFGLAKWMAAPPDQSKLTGAGQVMGTFHYMAPEQWEQPQEVDHRADIYSLGVVFYELLTGEVPMGHFPPPSQKVQIDVRLDRVVLRALARDRDRRYQQVKQIKTDLQGISAARVEPQQQTKARPLPLSPTAPPMPPAVGQGTTSRPASPLLIGVLLVALLLACGGVAVIGLGGASLLVWSQSDQPRPVVPPVKVSDEEAGMLMIEISRGGRILRWNVAGLLEKVGTLEHDDQGNVKAGYDEENDTVYFVMRTHKRYPDDNGQQQASYALFLISFNIAFYDAGGIRVGSAYIDWETGRKDADHRVLAIGTIDLSPLDADDRDRIVDVEIR